MADLSRRGFFQAIAATAVTLGYAAIQGPSVLASEMTLPTEQAVKSTLSEMARLVLMDLRDELRGSFTLTDSTMMDGVMTHQFNVQLDLPQEIMTPTEFRQRYTRPIAASFAERVRREGVTKFGLLPIPMTGVGAYRVSSKADGMSVRAIQDYDVESDQNFVRFDILCG